MMATTEVIYIKVTFFLFLEKKDSFRGQDLSMIEVREKNYQLLLGKLSYWTAIKLSHSSLGKASI